MGKSQVSKTHTNLASAVPDWAAADGSNGTIDGSNATIAKYIAMITLLGGALIHASRVGMLWTAKMAMYIHVSVCFIAQTSPRQTCQDLMYICKVSGGGHIFCLVYTKSIASLSAGTHTYGKQD
jgi:hypothetical protein